MDSNSLGDRFLKIMEDNNLNYRSMGKKCGLDESQIRKVIKGQVKDPRFSVVNKILNTFPEVSSDWLIAGRGNYRSNAATNSEENLQNNLKKTEKCSDCLVKDGQIEQLKVFNDHLIRRNEKMNQEIGRLKNIIEDFEQENQARTKSTG
jgi:predicted transcriptional regulator